VKVVHNDAMSYRITIEKIETVPYDFREWQKIADSGNPKDGGPVYDYAGYPSTRQNTQKVYEQTVESMDLPGVIFAVNQMPEYLRTGLDPQQLIGHPKAPATPIKS
jgi:hypothetical protein